MNSTLMAIIFIGGPSIVLALYGELYLKFIGLKHCKKIDGIGLMSSLFLRAVPLYGERVFIEMDQIIDDEDIKAKIRRFRLIRKIGMIGLALEFIVLIMIVNSRK